MSERRTSDASLSRFPSIRIWLCGPFTIEWVEPETGRGIAMPEMSLRGRDVVPALSLLKLLLCQPHRQAHRDWIMEQFWPESTRDTASHRLENIASTLRKLLRTPDGESLLSSLRGSKESGTSYHLLSYPHLWVDADALVWNVEQAARMERFGDDALPFWQRAFELAQRGPFLLDDPYIEWAQERRSEIEGHYRQSVHALARLFISHHDKAGEEKALLLLRTYWQQHTLDEDALRPLIELLGKQERYQEAEEYYQQCVLALQEEGRVPDPRTQDIRDFLRVKPLRRNEDEAAQTLASTLFDPKHIAEGNGNTLLSQFTTAISEGILLASRELGKERIQAPTSFMSNSDQSQRKASLDILMYKRNIRLTLHLHRTSTAQGLLGDVNADIQDLEHLERQVRGHDLYSVKEMLIGNHLLATKIVKDQRQYAHAYTHANNAVRVAKHLEDGDLIATTTYTRGCVKFEWAQFGTTQQGILQLNKEKVQDAIRDFQGVLDIAHVQRTPLHPQLQGFTRLQIGRAYSLLHATQDSTEVNPLTFIDQAESMVGCDSIEDAYMRLIITGTVSGLHWGAYHLNKAEILIALGMQDQALPELKCLKQLTERTYGRDETRNQTWSNMVMAEVLMGLEDYPQVISILRSALLACRSINSIQNTVTIVDMHSRLAISSYGTSPDVREIGAMLKEWYAGA